MVRGRRPQDRSPRDHLLFSAWVFCFQGRSLRRQCAQTRKSSKTALSTRSTRKGQPEETALLGISSQSKPNSEKRRFTRIRQQRRREEGPPLRPEKPPQVGEGRARRLDVHPGRGRQNRTCPGSAASPIQCPNVGGLKGRRSHSDINQRKAEAALIGNVYLGQRDRRATRKTVHPGSPKCPSGAAARWSKPTERKPSKTP